MIDIKTYRSPSTLSSFGGTLNENGYLHSQKPLLALKYQCEGHSHCEFEIIKFLKQLEHSLIDGPVQTRQYLKQSSQAPEPDS